MVCCLKGFHTMFIPNPDSAACFCAQGGQEGCWFMVYHSYRIMSLRLSICAKHLTNIRDRPLWLQSLKQFL